MKQTDVQILQKQRECLYEFMSEAKQDAAQSDLLQRSRNVSKLTSFKAKPRNATILENIIPPVFKPKSVYDDVLESFFPSTPTSEVLVDHSMELAAIRASTDKTLFTFRTPFKQLLRVGCTRSGRLWTSGNENMLRCIDMQNGSVVYSNTLQIKPIDICINDDDEVFVCSDKSVYN